MQQAVYLDAFEEMLAQVDRPASCSGPICFRRRSLACCPDTIELEIVSLDKAPAYEALSYAWGSADLVCEFTCGSKVLPVTRSCFDALKRTQPPCQIDTKIRNSPASEDRDRPSSVCRAPPRILWIDGICIDQSSLQERSQQVRLMADIYMKATTVLLWPGPDLPRSQIFFGSDQVADEIQEAFELLSSPYFSRIWPVQEVALSRECIVLNNQGGFYRLPDVLAGTRRIHSRWPEDQTKHPYMIVRQASLLRRMWLYFEHIRCNTGNPHAAIGSIASISRILLDARKLKSSEPRDKIFAIQGMLKIIGVDLSPPDYTRTIASIYTEAAAVAMKHDKALNILSGVTGVQTHIAVPSWVPDWSDSTCISEILPWEESSATGKSSANHSFTLNETVMSSYGIAIDVIEVVLHEFADAESVGYNDVFDASDNLIRDLRELIAGKNMVPSETCLEILCTLSFAAWSTTRHKYPLKGVVRRLMGEVRTTKMGKHLYETILQVRDILVQRLDRKILFKTREGRTGLASKHALAGDSIVLLAGCNLPMIIRSTGDDSWRIVAPAYVHGEGIMQGDLWDDEADLVNFKII